MINKYFPVLDHGFVALKDYMGSDESIEQAARVSYQKGTRKKTETRGLLRFLMRHRHTSPFEQAELQFHVSMPIFVARQWIRHRTAQLNEMSARYSVIPDTVYLPERENIRLQSTKNKQGRGEELSEERAEELIYRLEGHREDAFGDYEDFIDWGVARELARIHLPLNTYTQMYWKMDLHNLFHFLSLRCDPHAQWEIRVYANVIAGIVRELFPLSFEAWVDYNLLSKRLSRLDYRVLRIWMQQGYWPEEELEGMSEREKEDLMEFPFGDEQSLEQFDLPEPLLGSELEERGII